MEVLPTQSPKQMDTEGKKSNIDPRLHSELWDELESSNRVNEYLVVGLILGYFEFIVFIDLLQ